jgi:hypothetical protein
MRTLATSRAPSLTGGAAFTSAAVQFRDFGEEAATLRRMVNHFTGDLALKEFTLGILRDAGAEPKHEADQAIAIGTWVQRNIYYVHEGRETFQRPATTLKLRAGDCDDFSLLISSMLGTIGIREKLVILKIGKGTGARAVGPMRWAHIFPLALVVQAGETHRLTLDATLDLPAYPIAALTNPIALVKARGDRCEPLFV